MYNRIHIVPLSTAITFDRELLQSFSLSSLLSFARSSLFFFTKITLVNFTPGRCCSSSTVPALLHALPYTVGGILLLLFCGDVDNARGSTR